MSGRPGCLGGLLAIPLRLLNLGRGQHLIQQKSGPVVGLQATEQDALSRARSAAGRCRAVLHGEGAVDPAVLDQVGGAVDALLRQVEAVADRLGAARQWLRVHDPERISRELVELEVSQDGSVVDRMASMKALKAQARHAAAVSAGLPGLAGKLRAAAHRLEALEAKLGAAELDPAQLIGELSRQEAETARAVAAWQATVAEVEGL